MKPAEWRGFNAGVKLFFLCAVVAVTAVSGTVLAGAPGTPDPSFSGDGIVTADMLNDDYGADVATGSAGTVIVAGTRNYNGDNPDFAVVRYLPDGSLDTSFDSDGIAVTPFTGDGTRAAAVAVQDDGKILVTGSSGAYGDTSLTVVRYTAAGALDTTFSGDGILKVKVGSSHNWAAGLAIQEDGKILVAGTSWISDYDFVLLRLNADGSLDNGFGTNGAVTLDLDVDAWDFCNAVAVQGDGRIVGAGMTSGNDLTVVRYDSTGTLDTSFDGDGIAVTASCNEATDIAIQPNGRIVVVATQENGGGPDLAIVRYLSAGSLDPKFGTAGVSVVDLGGDCGGAGGVALQPNGRILASGTVSSGTDDFAALRLYGNPPVTVPSQFLLLGQ